MIKFVDTHSHIYQDDYIDDIEDVIKDAQANGIEKIYLPNVDLASIEPMHKLQERNPGFFELMMGLHPTSVEKDYQKQLDIINAHLKQYKYCAIGEIGIDLYWSKELLEEQKKAFSTQLQWAKELDLPVIIHTRDSLEETLDVVSQFDGLRGIFHSFGGSPEDAERILKAGDFYLGINGVVTFKNTTLRETLKKVSLDRIVLETDAPYLTPVPYRGKRNHPSYIPIIAKQLAEIYQVDLETIAKTTTKNASDLFQKCK
ncbi:MAG: TatD family hydrolase [Bacteroidales bacterium]